MITAGSRFSHLGAGLLAAALTAFVASAARADFFVSSDSNSIVVQYDENSGDFLNVFASGNGLTSPRGLLFGPADGNLYVGSGSGANSNILRFSGTDGSFIDAFVTSGGELDAPRGIIFGPDGNLYVSSRNNGSVDRYDGKTGILIDVFVFPGSGGLSGPRGLVFGPDGNLYVNSLDNGQVNRYNGTTGEFIDVFATGAPQGQGATNGLVFGPDGNLYVSSGGSSVIRYDGTSGQFIDVFVPSPNDLLSGIGGLGDPNGLLFGPDGNLYVGDLNNGGVRRYNGTTGDFIDQFVTKDVCGNVSYITFTKTDPTTLNYKP